MIQKIRQLNKESSMMRLSVEREAQNFVGITTLHGPLRIYRGHGFARWFWSLMMLIFAIIMMYQIFCLLSAYFEHKTVSDVALFIPEDGLDFPLITLCTTNSVRKRIVMEEYNMNLRNFSGAIDYIMARRLPPHVLAGMDLLIIEAQYESFNLFREYYFAQKNVEFDIDKFLDDSKFSCRFIVQLVTFKGIELSPAEFCDQATRYVTTYMGECIEIDTSRAETWSSGKQLFPGIDGGLQLVLDAHLEEQFDGTNEDQKPLFTRAFETGFRFSVHSPGTVLLPSTEAISVSPGTQAYSAISATQFELLSGSNADNCIRHWPFVEFEQRPQIPYSATACNSLCHAFYYMQICNCVPYIYNIDKSLNFTVCDTLNITYCESQRNNSETPALCSACKLECSGWTYAVYNNYGRRLSIGAHHFIGQQLAKYNSTTKYNDMESASHVRANFVTINVFFKELTYTKIQQRIKLTLVEVLSNIGGNMGLFLGMSAMTIVETVLFLSKMSWIGCSAQRRKHLNDKQQKRDLPNQEKKRSIFAISPLKRRRPKIRHNTCNCSKRSRSADTYRRKSQIFTDLLCDRRLHGEGYADDEFNMEDMMAIDDNVEAQSSSYSADTKC